MIYYEYGSLVLTYNSKETATRVFKLLQNSAFDDKNLYVMLLPNIQVILILKIRTSPKEIKLIFINFTFLGL